MKILTERNSIYSYSYIMFSFPDRPKMMLTQTPDIRKIVFQINFYFLVCFTDKTEMCVI